MAFQKRYVVFGVVLVIGLLLWNQAKYFDFSIDTVTETVRGAGVAGPLIFIILMALAIIVSPIPSLPLDAAAGIIWGPYLGTLYAVIGAEIGAIIAFLIARSLGRKVVEKLLKQEIKFCNQCSDKTLGVVVFVARLFPFFQFDIISYGAGLTRMRMKIFAIATFFGMIPATFVFTKLGHGFFEGQIFSIVLSVLIIIAMFLVPWLISKNKLHKWF